MSEKRVWRCDCCGFQMVERRCKVICPNCGARWDCSDVTIWVGDGEPAGDDGDDGRRRRGR